MSNKKFPSKKKLKAVTSVEWVGGVFIMPGYVMDGEAPYQPKLVIWMDSDGYIINCVPVPPNDEDVLSVARSSLKDALEQHAKTPTHLRISSREVADDLQERHQNLKIVYGSTPEFDHVMKEMTHAMTETKPKESYLSSSINPKVIASFFKSSTRFYNTKPWRIVPGDETILITIESMDVYDYVVSIIGQMEENFGFVVFSSMDDFEDYIETSKYFDENNDCPPKIPPHYSLNFERGADLSIEIRKEIVENKWEVSGSKAYPWLLSVDENLFARPLVVWDYMLIEAISLALSNFLNDTKITRDVWTKNKSIESTCSVDIYGEDVKVNIRIP